MTWPQWTALFVVVVAGLVVCYDLIAYSRGGTRATISDVFLRTARGRPLFVIIVMFLIGVLVGHLFLPQYVPAGD